MENVKKKIAKDLLAIKAVFFRPAEPFVWASGIKSPVYCDNRLTLSDVSVRNDVENAIAETVKKESPDAEILMGTSTAGIAHAAIAAHIMGIPMGYVRSGNKDHGRCNRIEGKLEQGQKTVVIEDLISTGGSVIETVEALREVSADVLGVVSIFTYGMQKGIDRFPVFRYNSFCSSGSLGVIGELCNGSTYDSDSYCLGSNPSSPASCLHGQAVKTLPSQGKIMGSIPIGGATKGPRY